MEVSCDKFTSRALCQLPAHFLPAATLQTTCEATRWLSWYGVGLASADRLPVVVRIPAGPLGSLKCDPPTVSPCSSSSLTRLTWGTHGCHT